MEISAMRLCHVWVVVIMVLLLSVNGEYYTHLKPEQLPELIKRLKYIIEND